MANEYKAVNLSFFVKQNWSLNYPDFRWDPNSTILLKFTIIYKSVENKHNISCLHFGSVDILYIKQI